jgi:FixJ family two-component response regulator
MAYHTSGFIVALVDDDPGILASLESLLKSAGHVVSPFASAAALLQSPRLEEIDCLISDIHLPVMDGVELMRAVHATLPNVPVILITGDPEGLNQLAVGCSHYRCFEKPFDTQALLTAVSDAVRQCALTR